MDNCPHCGGIRGLHSSVLQGCNCQWQMQSTQEKCRIDTVPAKGTLLPKSEWVGLTDDEVAVLMMEVWGCASIAPQSAPKFARAIEAKLKEKNNG